MSEHSHLSNIIDIDCEVVEMREKSISISDGTMEMHDGRERLKWFWLPRAQVEINGDGTVSMRERLALEKGLI